MGWGRRPGKQVEGAVAPSHQEVGHRSRTSKNRDREGRKAWSGTMETEQSKRGRR